MFQRLMQGKLLSGTSSDNKQSDSSSTANESKPSSITNPSASAQLAPPRYPISRNNPTPKLITKMERKKVKTEKPFPMWGRAHAGIQRQIPISMTKDELKAFGTDAQKQYTSIYGRIYDITEFRKYHPGGAEILAKYSDGKECGAMFAKYHQWVNVDSLLGNAFIGHLQK
mmetsp:Transcript_6594/g.24696  ORF Transcript_6594/g.24696 Transcript_6594/m.24696 type:complete len:170 (-) Transcript_6594:2774-3283(-)